MYDQKQIGRQLNIVSQIQFTEPVRFNYVPQGQKRAFQFDQQFSQWRTSSHPSLRTNKKNKLPQLTQHDFNQSNLPLLRSTYYNLENLSTDRYKNPEYPANHISNQVISIRYKRQTIYQKKSPPCLEPKPVTISLPKPVFNRRKAKFPSLYQSSPNNSKRLANNEQAKNLNSFVKKKPIPFRKNLGNRNSNYTSGIRNKSQHHQNSKNQIILELDVIERQHRKGKMRGSICKKKIWKTQKDKEKQRNIIFQLGEILKSQKNQIK